MKDEYLKPKSMADNKSKIQDLRMEPATNGVIISYTEKTEKSTKGTYDNCNYDYKKEVYDFDADDKTLDGAFERFKELWKQAHMTSM